MFLFMINVKIFDCLSITMLITRALFFYNFYFPGCFIEDSETIISVQADGVAVQISELGKNHATHEFTGLGTTNPDQQAKKIAL